MGAFCKGLQRLRRPEGGCPPAGPRAMLRYVYSLPIMLGPNDLVITGATLGNPPFRAIIEAAAAGGFHGVSISPTRAYLPAKEAGLTSADMRAIGEANGVVVNDVDAVVVWTGSDRPRRFGPPVSEEMVYEAGEALVATFVNVAFGADGPLPLEQATEIFAGICKRAVERGLRPHLEFVPSMKAVPDAATAWRVVQDCGCPEAGLLVDTWHCQMGPTTYDELRALPGDRVIGVQLSDASDEPIEELIKVGMQRRLPPGHGVLDLVEFIRILDTIGARAPLSVEVFSTALVDQHPPAELAKLLGDALRGVIAQARPS